MLPLIKYSGGKRREIKYFEKYIPKQFDTYIEPFVGGGAVYFYLEPKKAIINDLNSSLIEFYNSIKDDRERLVSELSELDNDESTYYMIRNMFNGKIPSKYSKSTLYYYINRTCFSGMIRYNKNGEFNVPFGWYKNVNFEKHLNLEASNLLKNTKIYNKDFEDIFKMANKNDFIFLDPPYMSSFKEYNPQGFSEDDQRRLFECFKNTEAYCLMVISDAGIIRELYNEYIIDEYEKTYSINIKDRMRESNTIKHLVVANYLPMN